VPAFLGNKTIFSIDECSRCNKLFGDKYENDFSKFTNFYRTILEVKGRKKIPKTKSEKIIIENINGVTNINSLDWEAVERKGNKIILNHTSEFYVPLMVWKCLAKIIYGLIPPNSLEKYTWIRESILNPDLQPRVIPCLALLASAPWIKLKCDVFVVLFEHKKAEPEGAPKLIGVLYFKGIFYHIPLLSIDQVLTIEANAKPLTFNFPPITENAKWGKSKPAKLSQLDLTSSDPIRTNQKIELDAIGEIKIK
jgi:hypothetical protein